MKPGIASLEFSCIGILERIRTKIGILFLPEALEARGLEPGTHDSPWKIVTTTVAHSGHTGAPINVSAINDTLPSAGASAFATREEGGTRGRTEHDTWPVGFSECVVDPSVAHSPYGIGSSIKGWACQGTTSRTCRMSRKLCA